LASTAHIPHSECQLTWANRTVLVVDVVESVRLIEQDELGVVSRWFTLVEQVKTQLIANGRLVKTLGDGMLLEFDDVPSAVAAALRIRDAGSLANVGYPPDRQILLRMGMEVSDVIVEHDDVHGRGVNIASRLMTLAGPGEIVVSQRVRDRLASALDADIEDLGECFLRHVKEPVRAYRIGPPGRAPAFRSFVSSEDLRPSIAVIPFASYGSPDDHLVLGEVIAEQAIRALSRSPEMNVISRLSTTVFRGRDASLADVASRLQADYVLSGAYRSAGGQVTLNVELAVAKSGQVLWAEHLSDSVSAILSEEQELVGALVTTICATVRAREVQRSRREPLPTLEAYTLLMGAVTLMHRLTRRDFEEAHQLLLALLDRRSREPITLAWLANWHNLRVQQGWSADPEQDAHTALDYTRRALDVDPDCSQALTVSGLVHVLSKRLDIANECYEQAIAANPSSPLAWLQKGTLHAFKGEGRQAVEHVERALRLSPLDPHRYYYDSLAASAYIAAREYGHALEFAERSRRENRLHTSTLRVRTVAQWHLGLHDDARDSARELMTLEPSLTVSRWLQRTPSAAYAVGRDFAEVLRLAGVPN
jgi:adenylate cyclase